MNNTYTAATPDETKAKSVWRDQTGACWYLAIVAYCLDGTTYYDGVVRAVGFHKMPNSSCYLMYTTPEMSCFRETLNTASRQSKRALEVASGEFAEMVRRFKDENNLILSKYKY